MRSVSGVAPVVNLPGYMVYSPPAVSGHGCMAVVEYVGEAEVADYSPEWG